MDKKISRKQQEKALKVQMMNRQAQELEKQLSDISKRISELKRVQDSLEEIKGNKGKEMLVPFGSGVLLKGKLVDDEKVLVNAGSKVMVEKTVDEAKASLNDQVNTFEEVSKKVEKDLISIKKQMRKQA